MALYSKIVTLLGATLWALYGVCAIVSIPVYLFRLIAIQLAKYFRPDLGDILNGQSGIFANDYFAKTAPRSNIVLAFHCEGTVTYEYIKNRAITGMVQALDKSTGRLLYDKLQQYPVMWFGFSFWKKAYSTFCIDDHVHKHSGMDTVFTDEQLTSFIEKLHNTRFSERMSPWEFHVIENFEHAEKADLHDPQHKIEGRRSIFIFKSHHCLADATGISKLLLEGLCENYSLDNMKRPKARVMKRTFVQKLLFFFAFPVNALIEYSYVVSHLFRSNPWKVADSNKRWHQVYAKSDLIPINRVKDIKNSFEVSFTSVLISLISGAIEKSTTSMVKTPSQTWPFYSMFPAVGSSRRNREALTNHFSAVIIDLPSTNFLNPLERLQVIFRRLEKSKNSTIPLGFQLFTNITGWHLVCVGSFLGKDRFFPISRTFSNIALSNFAGNPEDDLLIHEHAKLVQIDGTVGGSNGNIGVSIAVVSHNGLIRINVVAEEAVMTHAEAKQFAMYLNEEFESLWKLMLAKKMT